LRDRVARTLTRIGSRGPGEVVTLARERVREWASSEEELIMLARRAADVTPAFRHDPGLAFRQATPADGPLYARSIGTESARTFRRRLTGTTHCFLVEAGGELLHASWVTSSAAWTRELRAFIAPPPGDCYVYESFTAPAARGRGVYPFALAGICSWAAAGGLERVWVAVESHNAPSLKAITKAGFERSYSVRYGRRWGVLRLSVEAADALTPSIARRV
jgi:RimJ/RimL family protein N-acetyltransferase